MIAIARKKRCQGKLPFVMSEDKMHEGRRKERGDREERKRRRRAGEEVFSSSSSFLSLVILLPPLLLSCCQDCVLHLCECDSVGCHSLLPPSLGG